MRTGINVKYSHTRSELLRVLRGIRALAHMTGERFHFINERKPWAKLDFEERRINLEEWKQTRIRMEHLFSYAEKSYINVYGSGSLDPFEYVEYIDEIFCYDPDVIVNIAVPDRYFDPHRAVNCAFARHGFICNLCGDISKKLSLPPGRIVDFLDLSKGDPYPIEVDWHGWHICTSCRRRVIAKIPAHVFRDDDFHRNIEDEFNLACLTVASGRLERGVRKAA